MGDGGLYHWLPNSVVSYQNLPRMLGRDDLIVVPYMITNYVDELNQDLKSFNKKLLKTKDL